MVNPPPTQAPPALAGPQRSTVPSAPHPAGAEPWDGPGVGAPRTLTVGIDARAAAEVPAGRGRVVRELLRALSERDDDERRQRYVLYARQAWGQGTFDERFQWKLIHSREPWWHPLTARQANRECDVFFACNSYLTGWFLRVPCVPLVHDMAAFDPTMRPNRRSQAIERLTLGRAVRRAAALLVTTEATADALGRRYPDAAARTFVVPLGVAPALARGHDGERGHDGGGPGVLPAPTGRSGPAPTGTNGASPGSLEGAALPAPGFVLAVGTLEPRKNLPRLVAAYRSLADGVQARHPLVVVGANGWQTGETLTSLRSLGERCTMLGHVSDAVLAELYRRCAVFCYPSLGEGFGLPVLEAMAAGAAVLTSNVSSLPEVGGAAVAYADPTRVDDIAAQLRGLLDDPQRRADLSRRAAARALQFTWGRFAERTLEVLAAAADRGDAAAAREPLPQPATGRP
jgi:glycosyltransferase involved in cell wall biosynthesis